MQSYLYIYYLLLFIHPIYTVTFSTFLNTLSCVNVPFYIIFPILFNISDTFRENKMSKYGCNVIFCDITSNT